MQAVRWANDVVDNEALNKKKSKSARSPVVQPSAANIFLLPEHRAPVAAWSNTLGSHEQSAASSTSSGPLGTGGKKTTPAMGNATIVQSLRSRATTLDAGVVWLVPCVCRVSGRAGGFYRGAAGGSAA